MNNEVQQLIDEQLAAWEQARGNYEALTRVEQRRLKVGAVDYLMQFNPARVVSSGAKVDAETLSRRPCFLCAANRPEVQRGLDFGEEYSVLLNPFPIFPKHLTIPAKMHTPQRIAHRMGHMLDLARELSDYTIFYNGPRCGASAPDHMHFQAGSRGLMPIETQWQTIEADSLEVDGVTIHHLVGDAPRATLVMQSACKEKLERLFDRVYRLLPLPQGDDEPMMNLLAWYESERWTLCIFPRAKHRPSCYEAEGEERMLISPASVDLGGVFILPIGRDFERLTEDRLTEVLAEVCLSPREMKLIMETLRLTLASSSCL